MQQIFDTIGGLMVSIVNMIIGFLPFTDEQKEAYKASVSASKTLVGIISLVSMILACFLAPMLGLNKMFKKKARRRRKTRRRRK